MNMEFFEDDEEMSYGSDYEDQNESNGPWQCGLNNLQERAMALFRNGNYTDITLTFPGTDITYDVHCLILAMSSPVFEGMLYGPMKTEGENIELHGDDPQNISYILAYCYGYELDIPDMDTALEVYKLADKYILDDLKHLCCKHIVTLMNKGNVKVVMEFAEKFNFTDFLKHNCVPYFKEMFEDIHKKLNESSCIDDEPDFTVSSSILINLNEDWLEVLCPDVCLKVLDFHESWKNPESPLMYNRLNIILSKKWHTINKFYGCINAENIQYFDPENNDYLALCLSVTDPHHAKNVIDTINQQNRFEKHLIAIHIRCEEVWPRNWLPLRPERTYRPSMLLISETDDDKVSWVIEAAKALLPKIEGSYNKVLRREVYEEGYSTWQRVKPVTILKLPRSRLTIMGLNNLMQGLYEAGVTFRKILMQSPNISHEQLIPLQQINIYFRCLPMDHNFFKRVFKEFPKIR